MEGYQSRGLKDAPHRESEAKVRERPTDQEATQRGTSYIETEFFNHTQYQPVLIENFNTESLSRTQ
jgi:hypothetical protein